MAITYSTNNVLEAVKGQIEKVAKEYFDAVLLFDGELSQAITSHVSQPVYGVMKTFAFVAISDHVPDFSTGSGSELRPVINVDIHVVVRADGKGRYLGDRIRLLDAVDCVIQEVFHCDNRDADYNNVIVSTKFESRQRQDTGEAVLSHIIRYNLTVSRNA